MPTEVEHRRADQAFRDIAFGGVLRFEQRRLEAAGAKASGDRLPASRAANSRSPVGLPTTSDSREMVGRWERCLTNWAADGAATTSSRSSRDGSAQNGTRWNRWCGMTVRRGTVRSASIRRSGVPMTESTAWISCSSEGRGSTPIPGARKAINQPLVGSMKLVTNSCDADTGSISHPVGTSVSPGQITARSTRAGCRDRARQLPPPRRVALRYRRYRGCPCRRG